jgi:hypothetical protein
MQKKLKSTIVFLFITMALLLFFFQFQPPIYAYESCETDADCEEEGWECGEDGTCELVVTASAPEEETKGFELQVDIPGLTDINPKSGTSAIGEYIRAIYNYAIGVVGILAALVIMVGGVIWLTAGGNTNRIEKAKSRITAALIGLVIALSSYIILYTINPDLVELRTRTIESPELEEVEFNKSEQGCSWVTTANCPATDLSQKMTEEEKYCGEKPDPSGAATADDYQTCCCPPDVGEESEKESCIVDGTGCNDNENDAVPLCENCCNSWHYKSAAIKVCGKGAEGDNCENDNNCESGLYCQDGNCYNGNEGDPCEEDIQCHDMNCIDDQGVCSSDCESCGDGFTNICDEEECSQLGNDCDFTDEWGPNSCEPE